MSPKLLCFTFRDYLLSDQTSRPTRRIAHSGIARCRKCASNYKHLGIIDDVAGQRIMRVTRVCNCGPPLDPLKRRHRENVDIVEASGVGVESSSAIEVNVAIVQVSTERFLTDRHHTMKTGLWAKLHRHRTCDEDLERHH